MSLISLATATHSPDGPLELPKIMSKMPPSAFDSVMPNAIAPAPTAVPDQRWGRGRSRDGKREGAWGGIKRSRVFTQLCQNLYATAGSAYGDAPETSGQQRWEDMECLRLILGHQATYLRRA